MHNTYNISILCVCVCVCVQGCRLRNTKWMYGLVIYAGHDTKLVQNSGMLPLVHTYNNIHTCTYMCICQNGANFSSVAPFIYF